MNKSKHPFVNFAVFSVAVQAMMWVLFCLYDYGMDERHWVSDDFNYALEDVIAYAVMIIILILPIVLYILNRRRFAGEDPIIDALVQIPCWCAVGFAISYPIVNMVNHDKWIIAQEAGGSGGFINLNGIEYIAIPVIEVGFAILLLLKLAVVIVMQTRSRKAK